MDDKFGLMQVFSEQIKGIESKDQAEVIKQRLIEAFINKKDD